MPSQLYVLLLSATVNLYTLWHRTRLDMLYTDLKKNRYGTRVAATEYLPVQGHELGLADCTNHSCDTKGRAVFFSESFKRLVNRPCDIGPPPGGVWYVFDVCTLACSRLVAAGGHFTITASGTVHNVDSTAEDSTDINSSVLFHAIRCEIVSATCRHIHLPAGANLKKETMHYIIIISIL